MKAKKFTAFIAALAMIISILPTSLITAAAEEDPVRLTSMRFRAHPRTYSIFENSENLPTDLLWAEFNTAIDHTASYDKNSRTYKLDDSYYQIEISRPTHGPSTAPHQPVTIVPNNDITGIVKDEVDGQLHRYHGWHIGEAVETDADSLFEADDKTEYKVGEYKATLQKLQTTERPTDFDTTKAMPKEQQGEPKEIKIVHVTYTLSKQDIEDGYRLKCPMEQDAQEQIQELAMVGDMPAVIAPKADCTEAIKNEKPEKVVSGWQVVTGEADGKPTLSGAIGDYLPEDGKEGFSDGKKDNEIKLQAILKEPTSYAYEITKDDESQAFPTMEPNDTTESASFNKLAGSTEEPKTVEYNPTESAEPLKLRIVNKGNTREYIQVTSDSDTFSFKLNNLNAGKGKADQLYSEGGLSDSNGQFYIPSKADIDQAPQSDWVNYAELVITPKKGLAVGTHTANIKTRCYNSRVMIWNVCKLTVDISKKQVFVEPQSTEKFYGQELTDANIMCKVYDDDDGSKLLEEGVTAAQLGVNVKSEGMKKEAEVNGGDKEGVYSFTDVTETSNSNYNVTIKSDTNTGITVQKTTPRVNTVSATGIKDGATLSTSKVSGMYVNSYSHEEVKGTWDWVNGNQEIRKGEGPTVQCDYQFTPNDKDNYDTPLPGKVNIVVSEVTPTNLQAKPSSLTKTYNGKPQSPSFTWARIGSFREDLVTVTYKKVEDGNLSFDDEDYRDYKAEAPTEAGIYKVHATCPGTDSSVRAYSAGDTTAIFTIAPRTLQADFSGSVVNKAYDGTTNAEINPNNVTFKNKVNSADDVKIKTSAVSKATFADAGYDPHYPKTVTVSVDCKDALDGASASNYTLGEGLSTYHTTGYISSQRPVKLELTAENKTITKPYGVPFVLSVQSYQAAADQPEGHGLVNTDSISAVKATLTAADSNGADGTAAEAAVGEYTVKATTPQVSGYNYSITDDALGTLEVVKADVISEGEVTAQNGKEGNMLSSVKPEGAFVNKNNASMKVQGDLRWKNGNTPLQSGKHSYEWEFVPTGEDAKRYNSLTGSAYVTAGNKDPVPIKFDETNKEVTYDGNSHAMTAASTVQGAEITIEYRKTDIELHSDTPDTENWLRAAPKDAGTYEVRATAAAFGDYAENEERTTLIILQAEPEGSVTAGNVDKGAYLSDSTLTPSFTGVDGEPLEGEAMWRYQDGVAPGMILVDSSKDYEWEFDPTDDNYKSVRGTSKVEFNIDARKAEAEIYNLPEGYDEGIGDYARVNVDGTNLKAGDKIQFFRDAQMTDPESEIITITDEMSGKTKVNIDDDALNSGSGVLYLHIEGSSAVAEIPYKTQIGFRLNPTQVYMAQGDEKTISVEKSDDSYVLQGTEWTVPQDSTVTVTPAQDGASAAVTGNAQEGNATITVTATFAHPDPLETGKTVTTTNYATVTITSEQAPDYVYTTKDATDITSTGATLNGSIEITTHGETITPSAVGMFLIWEQGSDEQIRYGDKSPIVFSEAGEHEYNLAVDGLKPDTTYVYRAIGMAGDTITNGAEVTFKTKPAIKAENLSITSEGKATAKIKNTGSATMEISLIAASYDNDGRLAGINMETQLVEVNGESEITADIPDSGTKLKAFLWNTKTCEALEKAVDATAQ